MKIRADKTQQPTSSLAANAIMQSKKNNTGSFLEDNRPGMAAQLQQKDNLSEGKVMQLRRIVVSYKDSTVVGFDTENLTKDQIESLIDNPDIYKESKVQLQEALLQGDYKGGKPVQQEPQSLPPQQNPFSFGSKPFSEQQSPFSFGTQPLSNQQNPFSFGTQPLFTQQNPFGFCTLVPLHQVSGKENIRDKGLAEAKRKLEKAKHSDPGFEKIDDFIQFVSNPEKFILTGVRDGNIIALAKIQWQKVQIFEAFFDDTTTDEKRADTLIHEMSHVIYQSQDYSYKWNRAFKYLTKEEHSHNPDSVVTHINEIINEPSTEKPPQTTAGENVPGEATNAADKAFALLGDILYHTPIPETEALKMDIHDYLKTNPQIKPENHETYANKIASTINILKHYQNVFRNKNIHLIKGDKWQVQQDDNQVVITLSNTDMQILQRVVEGGTEKALVWLAFQITEHIIAAKQVIKIILHKFNNGAGKNPAHAQGLFPSAIKLDPEKV